MDVNEAARQAKILGLEQNFGKLAVDSQAVNLETGEPVTVLHVYDSGNHVVRTADGGRDVIIRCHLATSGASQRGYN